MVNDRRRLGLIFSLYVLLGIGYSLLMPIWEAPDEPAHYHLAWHLASYGEYATPGINYETHQPRGFYYFGSWIVRALNEVDPELTRYQRPPEFPFTIRKPERRFDWNDDNYQFLWGVYLLRWTNLIFGAFALWLNWKTFQLIIPEKTSLCLAALALAALTPQYLHIMSSVNNDAIGTLAGSFLFFLMASFWRQPSVGLGLAGLTFAIVLPFVTKLTVLPVSVAALFAMTWKAISNTDRRKWLLYSGTAFVLGAVILYLLFPDAVQTAMNEIRWRLFSFRKNAFSNEYLKFITSQILWTYWGKVGWLAVGLPGWTVYMLTGLGGLGIAFHAYRLIRSGTHYPNLNLWVLVWLIGILVLLTVFRNGLTTRATQGRLLFPAIGALSLLMVAGWHDVLPSWFLQHLPTMNILLLVFCNLLLWLAGIVPVYYQPFLD